MSLITDPSVSLKVSIGKVANPVFTPTQLLLSNNAKSSVGYEDRNGGKNSVVRCTMARSGYSGTGSNYYQQYDDEKTALFFINRLNIGDLATFAGPNFKVRTSGTKPTTAHQLLNKFKQTFGINLTTNDVQNTAITWVGDEGSVILNCNATSVGFTGTATLYCSFTAFEQGPVSTGVTSAAAVTTPRYSFGGAVWNSNIYVFAGDSNSNSTQFYNPNTNTWGSGASRVFVDHCACAWGDYIYVYYGNNNTLWRYDPVADTWLQLANSPAGEARRFATMVAIDGKLYLYGGINGSSTFQGSLYCYDTVTSTWSTKATGLQRGFHNSCVLNGEMYTLGGAIGATYFATLRKYNPVSDTWIDLPSAPRNIRNFGICNFGNRIYVAGGVTATSTRLTNITMFDPITNQWSEIGNIPTALEGGQMYAIGEVMYHVGGYDGTSRGTTTRII